MEVAHLKLRPVRTRQLNSQFAPCVLDAEHLNGGYVQHAKHSGGLKLHARVDDEDDDDADDKNNVVDDYNYTSNGDADDDDDDDDDDEEEEEEDDDDACTIDEPVTPAGRVFLHPSFNAHILVILGSKLPIDMDALKSGIHDTILKHKRFSSIISKNDKGDLYWVPTCVNLDKHIVIVRGEGAPSSPNFVENYVAQLMQAPPLNPSQPLFEFHVLRARLGDAAENVVLRVHHVLGDGTSLMSLLLACTRKINEPESLPTLPTQAYRSREKISRFKAFFLLLWSFFLMLWYTLLDIFSFTATMLWLEDSQTPLKGFPGVEKFSRTLAHQTISMDDIQSVKQAIHGTVNDVVYGMVAAGISRYLQKRYNDLIDEETVASKNLFGSKTTSKKEKIKETLAHLRVRACILVNTRPSPGLQELEKMMKGGSQARWGNQMGYIILPVPVMVLENPLEYVLRAKSIIDKRKMSLGAPFSYRSGTMLMNIVGSEIPTRFTLNCTAHTTLSFSNVSGPLEEVEFFGHQITHIIPTVAGQPQALCVHVQSYMGKATIVVSTAKDVIPDPESLCEHMVWALKEMKERVLHGECSIK